MKKQFTLLMLCCVLFSGIQAQVLKGIEANKLYPGAEVVRLDEQTNLPRHIQLGPEKNMNLAQAINYLKEYAQLGDNISFQAIRRSADQLDWEHHRYQLLDQGKPIVGAVYLFHTQRGIVRSMNGVLFNINQPVAVNITPEKAIEKAIAPFPDASFGWEHSHGGGINKKLSEYPNPELVWVPRDLKFDHADFRLAYKMDIYALDHDHHHRSWVYIDAQTGELVAEENRICEIDVPSNVSTVYSGPRTVLTEKVSENEFRLRQTTYGEGITTLNLENGGANEVDNAVDFVHEDSIWGIEFGFNDRHALDAHFGAEQFYLFLQDFFDRNSINGEGFELISYVHLGENVANAFWNGSASFYGDGGGGTLNRPLTTIDIVAHEFTHGLTDFTADLIYSHEPGAINESFSDIFGIVTEFYARPEDSNWLIGEDATSNGNGIRSAFDPNLFNHPDTYFGEYWIYDSFDNGGVHFNSGVQNYWFYLLSEGGSGINDNGDTFEVEGIGWEKAIAIAYRNLAVYLTPSSHYPDAAYFGALSALDLFGPCSQEYRSTVNAWHAVGLGSPISEEAIVDFESQRIFCNAPVDVDFFNNSLDYETVSWNFGDGASSTENNPTHTYTQEGVYTVTLTVNLCDGSTETVSKTAYIVIDSNSPVCSAMIMQDTGMQVLNDCSGLILDPAGMGILNNEVSSIIVIDPPTEEPLLLHFEAFDIGFGNFLRVYDGDDINAPILAQYTGSIGLNQTVETSSGVVTILVEADQFNENNPLEGFAFSYSLANPVYEPPIAGFTTASSTIALNAPVQFIDESQFSGQYQWDFGDGTSSSLAAPIHQYTTPGTYTITQNVVNCLGSDITTMELNIGAGGILSLNPDSICVTLNAGDQLDTAFTIFNIGTDDLYYSVFEDSVAWLLLENQSGEIAPGNNTPVVFDFDATDLTAGTYFYNINMESGDTSQFVLDYPVKMEVLPFPQTNYGIETLDLCDGLYQFNDQTLNGPTSWLWNFGDGNTSTESSPMHQYEEEGLFEISLITCNSLGCDSALFEQNIVISFCDSLTLETTGSAYFTSCNGLIFDQGGPDGNYADNSDYIIVIEPTGADFVTLTLNSFLVQPEVDKLLIYDGNSINAPLIDEASGGLSSGTTRSSTGPAMTLHFISNGAINFSGFELAWSCNGTVLPPDAASFGLVQDTDCDNTVFLDATPVGNYDYHWNMGDGNTVTTSNSSLEYNYQTPGTYTISLEISNAVGSSSFEQEVTINEIPFDLDALISADTVNINEPFSLQAILDISPASVMWIMQSGDTLTNLNEEYFYTEMGDYTILLEVIDSEGCKMFVETPIHVTNIVSTEEVFGLEKFQIIPNPSRGQFVLSLAFTESLDTDIILFNTLGQVIYREALGEVTAMDKELNFNHLTSGIYFISLVSTEGNIAVERIVIQK